MFGKKKKPTQPVGNSMLVLLTKKEQLAVAGGPRGPSRPSTPNPIH
jgi:hypothetical protein